MACEEACRAEAFAHSSHAIEYPCAGSGVGDCQTVSAYNGQMKRELGSSAPVWQPPTIGELQLIFYIHVGMPSRTERTTTKPAVIIVASTCVASTQDKPMSALAQSVYRPP